jgi:hypothetical protein
MMSRNKGKWACWRIILRPLLLRRTLRSCSLPILPGKLLAVVNFEVPVDCFCESLVFLQIGRLPPTPAASRTKPPRPLGTNEEDKTAIVFPLHAASTNICVCTGESGVPCAQHSMLKARACPMAPLCGAAGAEIAGGRVRRAGLELELG